MAADGDKTTDEDLYEIGGDGPSPEREEEAPDYDDDAVNLVPVLMKNQAGKDALKEISDKVYEDFTEAWESGAEWRKRAAADLKLFDGWLPDKTWPWAGCANAHVPIMFKTISRVAFRAYSELFGDWREVYTVTPTGPDDEETADVLTHHGNWQIRKKLTDFKRQMARGTLAFFMNGDVVAHSYWDPREKRNRHDVLTPDEWFSPYVFASTQPDFSDLPYYGRIFYLYKHDIRAYEGDWYGTKEVINKTAPGFEDDPEMVVREAEGEVMGEEIPSGTKNAPYKIIHYEGWIQLPGKDYECWCLVIMDYRTKALLKVAIHEEEDWQDRARFDRQTQEHDAYRADMEAYQPMVDSMMAQHAQQTATFEQGVHQAASLAQHPQEFAAVVDVAQGLPPPPELPPEPPPPDWVLETADTEDPNFDPLSEDIVPEPVKRVPIRMWSHAVCIEPLVGNLGLGFGRMEADYNRAANTMLSQFIDAATLANCKSYVISGDVDFEGSFEMKPGKLNRASGVSPSELKNAFVPLEPGQANPQLAESVDRMEKYGDDAVQAPGILSGEAGKSGETWRGVSARIEQATKQISVPTGALADWVGQVLRNNGKLNAMFMPEEEMFLVENHLLQDAPDPMDPNAAMQAQAKRKWLKAGRAMYEREYDVEIASDLRFASQAQRVSEADEVMAMIQSVPAFQSNGAIQWSAARRCFIARGRWDLVRDQGAKPPVPQMFGMPSFPPTPPVPGQELPPNGAPQPASPEAAGGPPA